MKKFFIFIWEIVKIVILALVIVLPIRHFIFQPFIVRGQSMEPNFEHGNYLLVDQISYRFRSPQRGEVVVFRFPPNPSLRYIKRIIGLPGETVDIADGKITIYKENSGAKILDETSYLFPDVITGGEVRITLDENEYFVLGDNRLGTLSYDSRRWGFLSQEYIIGRVFFRAWPFTVFARIETPSY